MKEKEVSLGSGGPEHEERDGEVRPFCLAVGLLPLPLFGLVMSHKTSQLVVRGHLGE